MKHQNIQTLIGAAIVDYELRQRLLEDAASVIGEFDLTPEESAAIVSIKAASFQGFASQLHAWVSSSARVPVLYA
jgi:hypothetical protein